MLLFDHIFLHVRIHLLHFTIFLINLTILNFNKDFHTIILWFGYSTSFKSIHLLHLFIYMIKNKLYFGKKKGSKNVDELVECVLFIIYRVLLMITILYKINFYAFLLGTKSRNWSSFREDGMMMEKFKLC